MVVRARALMQLEFQPNIWKIWRNCHQFSPIFQLPDFSSLPMTFPHHTYRGYFLLTLFSTEFTVNWAVNSFRVLADAAEYDTTWKY